MAEGMELGDADELARLRRKLDTLWAKDVTKRYNFDYGILYQIFAALFCYIPISYLSLSFVTTPSPLLPSSLLPLSFLPLF